MKHILKRSRAAVLLSLLILCSCNNPGDQGAKSLPRSTPEAEGVDSKGVMDFIKAAEKGNNEFHSFMLLRHGKVVAEGWWSPYAPSHKHTLYSLSKSFTSTAVGFAVSEKKLKLTDKIISFFPESLPDTVSNNLAEMELKDIITMTAGMEPDPTFRVAAYDTNWVRGFLTTPVKNKPGTKFLYNTLATYMLSAIVQKVTGEKVIDYLTPRLFKPLGIEGADWEVDPVGINTGGWGLRLKTEDMAKFGQLYLQKGKWNGKTILSAEWVDAATTFKIDQAPGTTDSVRSKNDWVQGYCYQFWRCRHNAFRGDGAFGQYIIVMPEKDAVVAITSETPDMQSELNLVWDYLLPALKDNRLPADVKSDAELKQMDDSLSVKKPEKGIESDLQPAIADKTFQFGKNILNIESVSLSFKGNNCVLKMRENGKDYDFTFGGNEWVKTETSRPGPNLLMAAKGYPSNLPAAEVAGIYRWREKDKLELTLRYIESPHTEVMNCTFKGDSIIMNRIEKYLSPDIPVIKGKVVN
jgi:CubicO group peptidase (beta-lactamase class C family)